MHVTSQGVALHFLIQTEVFGGGIIIRKFSQSRLPLAARLNLHRVRRQASVFHRLPQLDLIVVCDIFSRVRGDEILCCSTLFTGLWLILRDLCIRQELSLIMSRLILPLDMYRSINLYLLDQWSFYKKRRSTA